MTSDSVPAWRSGKTYCGVAAKSGTRENIVEGLVTSLVLVVCRTGLTFRNPRVGLPAAIKASLTRVRTPLIRGVDMLVPLIGRRVPFQ
jgi:hypothetical protein